MNRALVIASKLLNFAVFTVFLLPFAAFADTEGESAPDTASSTNAPVEIAEGTIREAMLTGRDGKQRKVKMQYENGSWYVLGKTRGGVPTNDVASVHGPDDLFLEINGDRLAWSAVDEQLEMRMSISPMRLPRVASAEDIAVVMATERRKHAQILLDGYIENALLAGEARKHGFSVTEEEVAAVMEASMKGVPSAKRAQFLARVRNPSSYFFRNQANFLLGAKYRDGVLAKDIEISADEIESVKAERAAEIAKASEAAAAVKPKTEALLAGLRGGSLDFEEVVFDESDTPDEENGEWGEFERGDADDDDGSFTKEMREFAFRAKAGEYGGVFESDDGFVILKVLKTDIGGREQADTVTLARVVKERIDIPEAFDDSGARNLAWRRRLAQRIAQVQEEALAGASITSAMPTKVLKRIRNRARRGAGGNLKGAEEPSGSEAEKKGEVR